MTCLQPNQPLITHKPSHKPAKATKPRPKPISVQCDICSKWINRLADLRRHKLTHASEEVRRQKMLFCDKCTYSTFQKSNLNTHKRSHTQIKSEVCPDCMWAFTDPAALHRHRVALHGYQPRKTKRAGPPSLPIDSTPHSLATSGVYTEERIQSPSTSSTRSSSSEVLPPTPPNAFVAATPLPSFRPAFDNQTRTQYPSIATLTSNPPFATRSVSSSPPSYPPNFTFDFDFDSIPSQADSNTHNLCTWEPTLFKSQDTLFEMGTFPPTFFSNSNSMIPTWNVGENRWAGLGSEMMDGMASVFGMLPPSLVPCSSPPMSDRWSSAPNSPPLYMSQCVIGSAALNMPNI